MPAMQVDKVRKGPLERLRALARAILSVSAEEEMRLQRQDFLKGNAKPANTRVAEGSTRGAND